MKNMFKLFVPVAAAAIALVSCNKEIAPVETIADPNEVHITVKATPDALLGETKTYIDNTNTIIWGTGEYMKIAVTGTAEENGATVAKNVFGNSSSESADAWDGEEQAMFEFSITPQGDGPYLYQGIYPASAAVTTSNSNPASYNVDLPKAQNATASSYDPKAYIMVAKPESFDVIQTEWLASYRRATALNKITLKNFNDDVYSVKVILPDGVNFTGRRHINLSTGESGDVYLGSNEVEILFADPLAANDGANKDIWFTSWNVELASGASVTFVVTSADKSYTKTITVGSNGLKFQEGYLNKLGLNLSGIEGETLEDYSGTYLIGAIRNGMWNLMSSFNSGSFFSDTQTTVSKTASEIVYTDFATAVDDLNDYLWKVAKNENGYYIQNVVAENYLAIQKDANESRSATSLTESGLYPYFSISVDSETGVATVQSTEYPTRVLYGNAGASRFAFYTSKGTNQDVFFIPASYDERTKVTLSFASANISKTTENFSEFTGQTVTASPSVEGIMYAISGDEIGTINEISGAVSLNGTVGSASVTATYAGNEAYRPATASYEISVSAASAPEWVETAITDLAAGDIFVIVGNNGNTYALSNDKGTSSAPSAVAVTVSDGKLSGTISDNIQWKISGNATDGYVFYPKGSSSNWLYCTATNNGVRVGTNDNKTFSIDSGYLKNTATSRFVGIYDSQDWRCYTSINSNIQNQTFAFYKLSQNGEGGEGGETGPYAYYKFSGSAGNHFVTNSAYADYSGDAVNALSSFDSSCPPSASWKMTCGDAQNNGNGDLWFGANSTQKDKLVLENGDFSEALAIRSALGLAEGTKYYGALICTTNFANICKIEITSESEMGGGAANQMWVLRSTNNGATYSVIFTKESPAKAAGTLFTVDIAEPAESASYALVFYRQGGQFQYKAPQITFYSK